jgi:hypothetical protein
MSASQHGVTRAWQKSMCPVPAGSRSFPARMGQAHLVCVTVGRTMAQVTPMDGDMSPPQMRPSARVEVTASVAGLSTAPTSKDVPWNTG